MSSVHLTTNLSIIVQIITGLVSFNGIFLELPDKHKILNEILALETSVQVIELFFYIYFLRALAVKYVHKMGSIRYFDWAITTPTMLLATIVYFKYEEYLEKNEEKVLTFGDFLKDNVQNIVIIVVCNFLMLLFGYLGEIGLIDLTSSIVLGFAFFAYTFYVIYRDYAIKSKKSLKLFYFILAVWSLYGVAAIFSHHHKNNTFNILDIFAKNFFGLYLYYKAVEVHRASVKTEEA
jgi:hypothetical protein